MTLLKKGILESKGSWNILNEKPVLSCSKCGTIHPIDKESLTIDSGNTASMFFKCEDATCTFQGVVYLEDFDRGLIIPPPNYNPPMEENSEKQTEFLA